MLNLGAGDNPLQGAVNLDIKKGMSGVNVVGDAQRLPFKAGAFDEVVAINPRDYKPLTDAARVLKPGGQMHIVAQTSNLEFRLIDRMTESELKAQGFRRVNAGRLPAESRFTFPGAKTTTGDPLYMGKAKQITLERIE